jgi:hypothetical protein
MASSGKTTERALGAQMQHVDIIEFGFSGPTDFLTVCAFLNSPMLSAQKEIVIIINTMGDQ